MSEYTFETAALKAVTIDAVKYNEEGLKNSLTADVVQSVVPMAWGEFTTPPTVGSGFAIGNGSKAAASGTCYGTKAEATGSYSTAIGHYSKAPSPYSIALGCENAQANRRCAITIGSKFGEVVNDAQKWYSCITEGTGSITIGAGANTLNPTNADGTPELDNNGKPKESSNSVTIGCKAENKGADSVVIGASASNKTRANVLIGTEAKAENNSVFASVAIGKSSLAVGKYCVAVGATSQASVHACAVGITSEATGQDSISIGAFTKAKANRAIAIGANATVSDYGATVIRSTAEDGTYTQLYFSGANTPLAKKYFPTAWEQKQDVDPETGDPVFDDDGNPVMVDDPEKPIAGEAMMGFVATDKDGNIIARGANMLSALFPYYTGEDDDPFQPTGMSLRGGEKPEPIAFHPSDLDMTTEEPATEPEEYQPLPVYPIVEPEMQEPEMSEYEPLPVYPIVEPETPEIDE